MKRPWKRLLLMVLLLLVWGVGGAVVNVAVAWAFAAWPPPGIAISGIIPKQRFCPDHYNDAILIGTSLGRMMVMDDKFTTREVAIFGVPEVVEPELLSWCQYVNACGDIQPDVECAFGWPRLSLRWFQRSGQIRRGLVLASHPQHLTMGASKSWISFGATHPSRILPYDIFWPGFAINTIFYAAILWLLLALPFKLRRWRRIKRGLCPACAYPVGVSAVCTECGRPITLR